MLIMAAAGGALVAARVFMGPGAALGAAVVFVVIRGVIALLVGPVLGEPDHVFPLYLAEAAIVELVALRVSVRRPLRFGLWCGALIGTRRPRGRVGVVERLPDPVALRAAARGADAGAGDGAGRQRPRGLAGRPPRWSRTPSAARRCAAAAVVAAVAVTAMIGYGLNKPDLEPDPRRGGARPRSRPRPSGPCTRRSGSTRPMRPPAPTRCGRWRGRAAASPPSRCARIGDGVYRTTAPVPALRQLEVRDPAGPTAPSSAGSSDLPAGATTRSPCARSRPPPASTGRF